jgi:hypothetical protein
MTAHHLIYGVAARPGRQRGGPACRLLAGVEREVSRAGFLRIRPCTDVLMEDDVRLCASLGCGETGRAPYAGSNGYTSPSMSRALRDLDAALAPRRPR